MTDHNLPIQLIEREIPDITKASGVRVEMVLQWLDINAYDAENQRWGLYRDVPIIRVEGE